MSRTATLHPKRLENLPNIGKAIAADLRLAGIHRPEQLAKLDPLETYRALSKWGIQLFTVAVCRADFTDLLTN